MKPVYVCGLGAVSSAGWGVPMLRAALLRGEPLPVKPLVRPGWEKPLRLRPVPAPARRPAFLSHPRLRRASAITQYATSAALEAFEAIPAAWQSRLRCGLIVCLQSGCVHYSHRFYDEVNENPATASPMLFPETVYAAPASHVAACLPNVAQVCTIAGDPACMAQGLALGARWLLWGQTELVVVIAAEETDWLLADALWRFEHEAVISAGAGALILGAIPELSTGVELNSITAVHTHTRRRNRSATARAMRADLPTGTADELLCDGQAGSPRADAPERDAWADWPGIRLSPRRILGEGLMAAAGWQCVAACDAVTAGGCTAANVSLVGVNQHSVGMRFIPGPQGSA
jgi:hypothetical protein